MFLMAEASFVSEGKVDGMEGVVRLPPPCGWKGEGSRSDTKTAPVTQFDDERWMRDRQTKKEAEEGRKKEKNRPLHCRPQFLIFTPRPPHFTGGESQAGENITFILIRDGSAWNSE